MRLKKIVYFSLTRFIYSLYKFELQLIHSMYDSLGDTNKEASAAWTPEMAYMRGHPKRPCAGRG